MRDRKTERVAALKDMRVDPWFAPAPNNSLITARNVGASEIYALDWEAPQGPTISAALEAIRRFVPLNIAASGFLPALPGLHIRKQSTSCNIGTVMTGSKVIGR